MSLTKVKKLVLKFNCELCFRLLFNLWLAQVTLIQFYLSINLFNLSIKSSSEEEVSTEDETYEPSKHESQPSYGSSENEDPLLFKTSERKLFQKNLKKSTVKCPVFDFDVSEDESNEDLEKSISEVIETIFSPKGKKYFIKIQAFVVNFYQPYKRNLG